MHRPRLPGTIDLETPGHFLEPVHQDGDKDAEIIGYVEHLPDPSALDNMFPGFPQNNLIDCHQCDAIFVGQAGLRNPATDIATAYGSDLIVAQFRTDVTFASSDPLRMQAHSVQVTRMSAALHDHIRHVVCPRPLEEMPSTHTKYSVDFVPAFVIIPTTGRHVTGMQRPHTGSQRATQGLLKREPVSRNVLAVKAEPAVAITIQTTRPLPAAIRRGGPIDVVGMPADGSDRIMGHRKSPLSVSGSGPLAGGAAPIILPNKMEAMRR